MRIVYISMNTLGINCLDELLKQQAEVAAIFTIDKGLSKNISDFEDFGGITGLFKEGKAAAVQQDENKATYLAKKEA